MLIDGSKIVMVGVQRKRERKKNKTGVPNMKGVTIISVISQLSY